MNSTTILILVATVAVIALTLIPTYIISGRKKTTQADWEVADRSLPLYVVIGTQFASAMGGGILVAHVGNAYARGIGHFIYGVLASLPFIIIMVLAKWLRRNNFTTIPDVLAHFTNGNKLIRIVAGVMTVFVPFGWVTSQITAFGNIYSNLTGIDYTLLCVLFAVFALAFVMPSGLKTVAWTDFIFSCFMIVICIVCVVFVTVMGGGVSNIVSNLNTIDPSMLSFSSSITDNIGVATCMLWIFAVLPGGMTNQIYFQRVCAIKEEKQVNKSLILSGALSLLSFVWAIYMGLSLRSLNIADGVVHGQAAHRRHGAVCSARLCNADVHDFLRRADFRHQYHPRYHLHHQPEHPRPQDGHDLACAVGRAHGHRAADVPRLDGHAQLADQYLRLFCGGVGLPGVPQLRPAQ